MGIRNHPWARRVSVGLGLFALFSACSWGQAPDAAIASLAGRRYIFPKGGAQSKINLKKSQLSRFHGTCDVAVLVKDANWKAERVMFTLQTIGTASVVNQQRGRCDTLHEEISLELSEFAVDEPVDSILNSVRQVLQTPEEYLAYKGLHLSLPPGPEDEIPVSAPPTVFYPKALLRVDGAYTAAARSARLRGDIKMSLIVGTDGRPHNVHLLKGLGLGLDESAIRALQLWRFEPARQMDKEVAVRSTVDMHFDIM